MNQNGSTLRTDHKILENKKLKECAICSRWKNRSPTVSLRSVSENLPKQVLSRNQIYYIMKNVWSTDEIGSSLGIQGVSPKSYQKTEPPREYLL